MQNSILITVGNILLTVPQLLFVVLVAHLGTFVDSAHLGFIFSWVTPISVFFQMQHNLVYLSGDISFNQFRSLRVNLSLVYLIILIALVGIFQDLSLLIFSLVRFTDLLNEITISKLLADGRYKSFFSVITFRTISLCLIFSLSMYLFNFFYASVSLVALSLLFLVFQRKEWYDFRWEKPDFVLLKTTFFLGISSLLAGFLVMMPRYLLHGFNAVELGVFSNFSSITSGISIFSFAIVQKSIQAKTSQNENAFSKALLLTLLYVNIFYTFVYLLLNSSMKDIILILFGSKYVSYTYIIPYFFAYLIFSNFTFYYNTVFLVQKKYHLSAVSNLSSIFSVAVIFLSYQLFFPKLISFNLILFLYTMTTIFFMCFGFLFLNFANRESRVYDK